MPSESTIEVRFFSLLHTLMRDKAVPSPMRIAVPESGSTGDEIARELGIPVDRIEAVFCNGIVQGLHDPILPGDRVSLVPPGTPGPYRVLLGIAGRSAATAGKDQGNEPPD